MVLRVVPSSIEQIGVGINDLLDPVAQIDNRFELFLHILISLIRSSYRDGVQPTHSQPSPNSKRNSQRGEDGIESPDGQDRGYKKEY
jgi:hypothetical protein